MDNKKKFVIVISIISILMLCFSVSSFAFDLEDYNKPYIASGTRIRFNNTPVLNISFTLNSSFVTGGNYSFTRLQVTNNDSISYTQGGNGGIAAYRVSRGTWYNEYPYNNTQSITVLNDIVLSEDQASWFVNNSDYNLIRIVPKIQPTFWENVSGFFTQTLNSGTAIVNWMTITPISLIPLALYCLIVIIAISKRLIKG